MFKKIFYIYIYMNNDILYVFKKNLSSYNNLLLLYILFYHALLFLVEKKILNSIIF